MDLFAATEVPSLCLRDRPRTEAFRDAIRRVVRPGNVVLDAGCGSGILSLFAAAAGASKVYALDADPHQVQLLRANAAANGFAAVIEPIVGDARTVAIPTPVDVLIAEMIDTWLLDEHQAPAVAALRARGVLNARTRCIPSKYDAFGTFGTMEYQFYGFHLRYPLHDWPDFDAEDGWHPTGFTALIDAVPAYSIDFHQPIDTQVRARVSFTPLRDGVINAVRLSGVVHLGDGTTLGSTLAFNGEKIHPLDPFPVTAGKEVEVEVSAHLGAGLGTLQIAPPAQLNGRKEVICRTTRIHSWLSPKCRVQVSALCGQGVFARVSIAAGELITVWGGVVYTADEVETWAVTYPKMNTNPVSIWDGHYLGPLRPGDPDDAAELFNHSCDPNAGVVGQVILVARRPITAGEEVTFDYNTTETEVTGGFECQCGSSACRGVVDGQAWRDPAWRARNTGYLSTYVGEKVRRELHPRG
jgi:SAM-dependent methyltransferase